MNEMVSGVRADLGVKLFGDDFDVLVKKAQEIEAVLRSIPGNADVNTEQVTGQPMLQIKVNQEQVARYGVSAQDVLDLVESIGSKPLGRSRRRSIAISAGCPPSRTLSQTAAKRLERC